MAKKRKTPAEPLEGPRGRVAHADHDARTLLSHEVTTRDTDEEDRGELLDGFRAQSGELLAGLDTQHDVSALGSVEVDEELLDLRGLADSPKDVQNDDSPTLLKIFARRRRQIGLSLDQLARLSGIAIELLDAFEQARPGQTITYDQAVVLSRALGIPPEELPGLRRRETPSHLNVTLTELERTLVSAPLLRFEGAHGERFGGDVERAASSKAFSVRIEDDSLHPALSRGTMLGFISEQRPRKDGILLLRHRRSALLAIRRYEPPAYVGLVDWQPSYVVGGEWHLVGCLEVMLPPR